MKNNPLIILALFCFSWPILADQPVSTGRFNNLVITGHNTVAYHQLTQGDGAVKGDKIYSLEWKGADWYFGSQEERERFKVDPERYAPAYNGFCANALSIGEGLIRTNGKHWAVFDDQLYVFYAARGAKRWLNGDYREYKVLADKAWAAILDQ